VPWRAATELGHCCSCTVVKIKAGAVDQASMGAPIRQHDGKSHEIGVQGWGLGSPWAMT
jgi:hypothetical protein